jgi:hypothetical protein
VKIRQAGKQVQALRQGGQSRQAGRKADRQRNQEEQDRQNRAAGRHVRSSCQTGRQSVQ